MSVNSSQQLSQGKAKASVSPLLNRKLDNAKAHASEKREQILKGATQVFLRHGYAGTSMDRVAATAGVSKQTIYSHFQDKNGLFTALIERVTIRQLHVEFGTEPFQGEPRTLLRRIAHGYLKKMDDREYIDLLRLVIAESAHFPELAKLFTSTVIQPICLCLSVYFEAHPELNLPDPAASAQIFFGSLSGFILSQQLLYGRQFMPLENERLVDTLVELCCQNYLED